MLIAVPALTATPVVPAFDIVASGKDTAGVLTLLTTVAGAIGNARQARLLVLRLA